MCFVRWLAHSLAKEVMFGNIAQHLCKFRFFNCKQVKIWFRFHNFHYMGKRVQTLTRDGWLGWSRSFAHLFVLLYYFWKVCFFCEQVCFYMLCGMNVVEVVPQARPKTTGNAYPIPFLSSRSLCFSSSLISVFSSSLVRLLFFCFSPLCFAVSVSFCVFPHFLGLFYSFFF